MIPAVVLGIVAGAIGWLRAKRAGGGRSDMLQYATAHFFATFIVVMILMSIAHSLGWLGY
ncbi:MAG: hypothetical protein AAF409_07335 [Pseudomonadota bacterium]